MKDNNRLIYIDWLKIFAIFAVIIIHVNAMRWYQVNVNSFEWNVYNFYYTITKWSVPVFVMASGVLFLNQKKQISIKQIYFKYITRLVSALLFWSFIYIIIRSYTYGNVVNFETIVNAFLGGQVNYQLWFVYMIIGIYIVTPIVRKAINNSTRKETEYFLILCFLFTSLFPFISSFSMFLKFTVYQNVMISCCGGFLGYYVLGHYLSNYEISKKLQHFIYFISLLSLIFIFFGTMYSSHKVGISIEKYYGYLSPMIVFISASIFLIFKNHFRVYNNSDKKILSSIVRVFSNNIFGVFLVHDIFIIILIKNNIMPNIISPILGVPIFTFVIFILSLFLTLLIGKIPFLKKYIL